MKLESEIEKFREMDSLRYYFIGDSLVKEIFHRYPSNKNEDEVILKVRLLDSFYGTNLEMSHMVVPMAKHIVQCSKNKNLDEHIEKGSFAAVCLIAEVNKYNYLSFASKYCCNSNFADSYFIYDSIVSSIMYDFTKEHKDLFKDRITKDSLKDYEKYCFVCKEYKRVNNLEGSNRDMDWFLWCKRKMEDNNYVLCSV